MRSHVFWFLCPALIGLVGGAMLGTPDAHACDCGGPFWVLGERQVESSDPSSDDARFWGHDGHVYPDSLSLWASDATPAFTTLEFAP